MGTSTAISILDTPDKKRFIKENAIELLEEALKAAKSDKLEYLSIQFATEGKMTYGAAAIDAEDMQRALGAHLRAVIANEPNTEE